MSIELTILISVVSVSAAVYFGLKSTRRAEKQDVESDAAERSAVMVKLENIQTGVIELRTELKSYKEEMQRINEQTIRNEESLKSLHKRVDRMETLLHLTEPHEHAKD